MNISDLSANKLINSMIPMGLAIEVNTENYFANSSKIVSHKIQRNYLLLTLLAFPLLTIFDNMLVVISVVKERYLRTTTNYYIVSLAIADISLAVSVMPLCTWLEVLNFNFYLLKINNQEELFCIHY